MNVEVNLEEIKQRLAAATEGPWRATDYDPNPGDEGWPILGGGKQHTMSEHLLAYCIPFTNPNGERDAAFIAAARSDVPALVGRVEELEAALRDLATDIVEAEERRLGMARFKFVDPIAIRARDVLASAVREETKPKEVTSDADHGAD